LTLYRPEAFEPLTDAAWDEGHVRGAIEAIAANAQRTFDAKRLWPATEGWDSAGAQLPLTTLHTGASGVTWALQRARQRGHADVRLDLRNAASRRGVARSARLRRAARAAGADAREPLLRRDRRTAGRVQARADAGARGRPPHDSRENAHNETDMQMSGVPGAFVASRALPVR